MGNGLPRFFERHGSSSKSVMGIKCHDALFVRRRMVMASTVSQKRAAFRALHERGCFVIPNPWDVGSARMLESLGFKALASTSSGFAWSQGHADSEVSRNVVLEHLRVLAAATDLPVNAD